MAKSLSGEMILWVNISNYFPDEFITKVCEMEPGTTVPPYP
jgi:hypothetical protein